MPKRFKKRFKKKFSKKKFSRGGSKALRVGVRM